MSSVSVDSTAEFKAPCEHKWRELSKEERERYGTAIARCLENWRECKNCQQVKYVGNALEETDVKPWE